jgi:hypothetical protein
MQRSNVAIAWLILSMAVIVSADSQSVYLDASLFETCVALASDPNDQLQRDRLMGHPNTTKMKQGWGERFHISFEQIAKQRERLEAYRTILPNLTARTTQLAEDASRFLGAGNLLPAGQGINIVCGGPFDAYGFGSDPGRELFVDITLIEPDFLEHLMRHEYWHLAFKARYPEMFNQEYGSAEDPLRRLAYQMLNEGVGHYYSFRRRVEPVIEYSDWEDRTQEAFSLLAEGTKRLALLTSREEQDEVIWSAHSGVPFWQKWGAIPGAIITYRLNQALEREELAEAISRGSCGFLSRYADESLAHPSWESLPPDLIEAACGK